MKSNHLDGLFERTLKKADKVIAFLGEIDKEMKEGKITKAFIKLLLVVFLVIIIAAILILSIWYIFSTFGTFMKIVAGIMILLILIPIILLLNYIIKKFT